MTTGVWIRSGNWTVVPEQSTASFSVRNLGFNRVTGTIPIRSGSARRDGDTTEIRAELDLKGLITGNARRDADLRKPQLLDSEARPKLFFLANQVRDEANGWQVEGALELRGTTCPVTLHVEPKNETRLVATAVLDRAPLRMRAPRFMIGRYLDITIDVRLTPQ